MAQRHAGEAAGDVLGQLHSQKAPM
jgi:hypothetical protein